MLGNKIKILLFIGFTFAMNGEIHSIYNQALQAYQVGHFELAINNYENILNNEWESPQLYYILEMHIIVVTKSVELCGRMNKRSG